MGDLRQTAGFLSSLRLLELGAPHVNFVNIYFTTYSHIRPIHFIQFMVKYYLDTRYICHFLPKVLPFLHGKTPRLLCVNYGLYVSASNMNFSMAFYYQVRQIIQQVLGWSTCVVTSQQIWGEMQLPPSTTPVYV